MRRSNGFSTGIDLLDRRINGGLPPGSILCFTAPPASQSEEFLYQFTKPRQTIYSTTVRTEYSVQEALEESIQQSSATVKEHTKSPMNEIKQTVGLLEESATLIIDTIDPIEKKSREDYMYFLNDLQNEIGNTDSIIIIHAMKSGYNDENRVLTKQIADVVFDLTQVEQEGNTVAKLTVQKYRGGSIPEEPIKLDLTEGIRIDQSKNIS